jgi:hypothetical protein
MSATIRHDGGAALVEFAIVAPVLLFTIIGGLDLSLELLNQNRLLFVTQQAAVAEAKSPGTGPSWAAAQMPGPIYSVTSPGCISAQFAYSPIVLPTTTLEAAACAVVLPSST